MESDTNHQIRFSYRIMNYTATSYDLSIEHLDEHSIHDLLNISKGDMIIASLLRVPEL